MKRREFLKGAALLAAGVGAGAGASLYGERQARALAFGGVPPGKESSMVPDDRRVDSILEVFLFGGLSQYESLYCVEGYGEKDGTQWHAFMSNGELQKAVDSCNFKGSPQLLQPFAADANGVMASLGPFAMPLREREDVLARTRICMTAHQAEPHEVAIPLSLSGRSLGNPMLAGLGAHIERYAREQSPSERKSPYAYVLQKSAPLLNELTKGALATGLHPASYRPLGLKIDAAGDLTSLLTRAGVGDARGAHDALVRGNIDRFRARLRWKGQGEPLRAGRVSELSAAALSLTNADAIVQVLDPKFFVTQGATACGAQVAVDTTTMSLNLAAHLLTQDGERAKYVCVIDGGLMQVADAGGYDSHSDNCSIQSRNLTNTLRSLMSIINAPGEKDPTKIDLDRTMIILNTEFGRTPELQGNLGRGHWPYGYPVAYIGGPIREDNRGIYGACGSDARASLAVSPQEHRIAALVALGAWPFAQESFNVSDVVGAGVEAQAVQSVKKRVLGLS